MDDMRFHPQVVTNSGRISHAFSLAPASGAAWRTKNSPCRA